MKHTASCWCNQDEPQTFGFGLTNESITNCIINHLSNQHFQSMLVFFLNTLLWLLPVLVLHQKYLCSFPRRCFQSRWFEGGTEAGPRLCKGEEMGSTEPSAASAATTAPVSPCPAPAGWRKTPILSGHSPAYARSHGRYQEFHLHWNGLSEGKLEVSTTDSSCSLQLSVRSTNVPTTTTVPHLLRISNTTRDVALERLLKYLPEWWLRLLQNLRRTENCLRGGTWKQRGHFSKYGLTDWKTKPHFTPTHPYESSCEAWRSPALAHPYTTRDLSCCVKYTRNPEHLTQWQTGCSFRAGVEKITWK